MTASVAFRAYFNSFADQNIPFFKYVSCPTIFIDVFSY